MTTKLPANAYRKLADLLDLAQEVRSMFEQSGTPLPEELRRLYQGTNHSAPMLPWKPPAPVDAGPDWLWVETESATPSTLALAILRESSKAMNTNEIHAIVSRYKEDVSLGTIANIGTRADKDGIIERRDGNWFLLRPEKAGVLHDGYVWGSPDIFEMQEKASLRRKALLRVLSQTPLQQVQLVSQLHTNGLVPQSIPVNKTLIKADIEVLHSKGKVRRVGHSKKWESVDKV